MIFSAGDFSLNIPQSDRPVEVDNDQFQTLIENNQQYTTWKIASRRKVTKSIKLLVKMNKCVFYGKKNGLFSQPNIFSRERCILL